MNWLLLAATVALASAKDVSYEFDIKPRLSISPYSPDCYTGRDLLLVNNELPGPTIRANVGDTIHIKWHNLHPSEGVSIHYHGLLMQDQPYADGAGGISTCVVGPMQSFEHTIMADNAGTHYWHGHTSLDRMDGLQGLIIIDNPDDPEEQALVYDEERIIWLQDWYHKSGPSLRTSLDSGVWIGMPQSVLINGKGQYQGCIDDPSLNQCDENCSEDYLDTIPVEDGKTYLFRVINAGALLSLNLAIANHTMTVVQVDGGKFVKPFDVTSLEVNVAQRYSVLVKADQAPDKSYYVVANSRRVKGVAYLDYNILAPLDGGKPAIAQRRSSFSAMPDHDMSGLELDAKLVSTDVTAHPQADILSTDGPVREMIIVSAQSMYPPLEQTKWTSNAVSMSLHSPKPLAVLAYEAANDEKAAPWPSTVIPGTVVVPDVQEGFPAWDFANAPADEGVSGIHTDHGLAISKFVLGDVIDIVFQNTVGSRGTAGSHAWHLHGHQVYVIGQGEGTFDEGVDHAFNYDNPVMRDTFSVWDYGWTMIRLRANNAGVWPFHCTMASHAIQGMGFNVITSPDKLSTPPPGLTSCMETSTNPDDAQVCMTKTEYENVQTAAASGLGHSYALVLFMVEELMRLFLI